MKIYITGSYGMVGRNITDVLANSGNNIIRTSSNELNLLNYEKILDFLKERKPDIIIHCAGKVGGIQANIKDPYGFFTENILMGVNLIKASKEAGIKYLLNVSSSCFYPFGISDKLSEDLVFAGKMEPTNEGFAIAKASVTKLCSYITNQFKGKYIYKTIVPCNLYGKYDKFDESVSHMIPAVIKKIHDAKMKGLDEVTIWGDGESRREFMYTGDLACMVENIIENFDRIPDIMNLGLGFDYSINDYYKVIADIIGYKGRFKHDLSKPSGVRRKLLDISKQLDLGIKAKVSLEEGIKHTYNYYLEEILK